MKIIIDNNKYYYFFKFAIICASIFVCFANYSKTTSSIIAIIILLISVYNVIRSKNNIKLFIVNLLIAYFNYSICIANYLAPIDNYFTSWRNYSVSIFAINILFLFNVVYSVFLKIDNSNTKLEFFKNGPNNGVIVLGGVALLTLIFIVGFGRPDVDGQRGAPSTIYEYSTILFIVVIYYCKTTLEKAIVSIILFAYAFQNLMYGGRVTALQLIIIWALIFISDRFSVSKIFFPMLICFIMFSAIGEFRASFELSIESIEQTVSGLVDNKFTNDTSYSAYFTSLTFIDYGDSVDTASRLSLFVKFLLSMIFGGSAIEGSNLAQITRQFYTHYYGGVLPYFGYFYLGWLGVTGIGLYVSFLINKFVSGAKACSNGLSKCIAVYIVSTCPRWYLYSPSQLFRGLLLLSLVYGVCYLFHSVFVKKNNRIGLGLSR